MTGVSGWYDLGHVLNKTPRASSCPDARGILYRVPYFRRDQVILSLDRLARPTPAQEQVRKSYRRQQP